jgi:hypothetical protein
MKKLLALMPFATASQAPETGESANIMQRGRQQMIRSHIVLIVVAVLVLAGSQSSHFDNAIHLLILAVTAAKSLTDAWQGNSSTE